MERRLTELWYRERPRPSLLQPLAWLYGAAVSVRRRAYRAGWLASESVGRPVVVVGNLTVGGTGKTPLTIWLARELSAHRLEVGIVSRGYGGSVNSEPRLVNPAAPWQEVGDEPLVLSRRTGCATMVGVDRVAAARALVARGVDLILADDGLQHLRLERDCEIVVIDGARGFGNGRLLPAGPLRESLERLRQADVLVVNGVPAHGSLAPALAGRAPINMRLTASEAVPLDGAAPRPLAAWRGQRVHAVAGIGNPQRFFAELRAHGMEVIAHAFPDHHPFTALELEFADDGLPVLMTEKDAVKCAGYADSRLWYVPVAAELSAPDARELLARVLMKVRGHQAAGGRT